MKIEKITIRVYALIVENNKILLSDEFWYDTPMTKFPGGGLEPGESIIECLYRELSEELNCKPIHIEHLLTCKDFIVSNFHIDTQVIPIYYIVKIPKETKINTSKYRFDFLKLENGSIRHRWINIEDITEDELTFEGDKIALRHFKTNNLTLL